ncbi:acyl-[acyl-carrier-protein] thioesterase [Anaeromyxobacter diazotrophicus]|uniref:Acyl-ACP thioesterase n=1 Tax=Anaeromyxobacter diazotrophicus TaxID=2590199 RepID=A0A7I9VP57_9BACT|nr:acyl-ACP thioesterase domain-containing protein [Anaeromyxobacter diazotrophicus]GEJ58185.1 acyl-ACP thioesterase [Anaeromyxobacter diazotrophicus]
MLRHVERIPVHGYDTDAFGELALPALASYLQEVAGHHATALGCGLDALRPRGLTWVLVRQRVEAPRPIALGEELEIATWPSGLHPLVVTREFTVSGADGQELARASTAWLVLDLTARKPVRPEAVLDAALRPHLEAVAPVPPRLPPPAEGAPSRRFEVRYADIDLNRHVTNTSYLGWALEGVPEASWLAERASAVEVHYLAEARLGDAVRVRTEGGAGERLHAVVREADGRELARLRTRWAPR